MVIRPLSSRHQIRSKNKTIKSNQPYELTVNEILFLLPGCRLLRYTRISSGPVVKYKPVNHTGIAIRNERVQYHNEEFTMPTLQPSMTMPTSPPKPFVTVSVCQNGSHAAWKRQSTGWHC